MGIVFVGYGVAGFFVGSVLGVAAILTHHRLGKTKRRGSWPAFALLAGVAFYFIARFGLSLFPEGHEGAPTDADYQGVSLAFLVLGASPGLAMVFGALALLIKRRAR